MEALRSTILMPNAHELRLSVESRVAPPDDVESEPLIALGSAPDAHTSTLERTSAYRAWPARAGQRPAEVTGLTIGIAAGQSH
jgi:hypothetical protein